jgi:two-component system chemotaxis response regulator CheB
MRIFVLDDPPLSRRRLIAHLSRFPEIDIVGETGDPLEAIGLIREQKPDAVILDARVSRRFGIDILQNIKNVSPAPEVVMLTNRLSRPGQGKCFGQEADFCFDRLTELDEAIRAFVGSPRKGSGHACAEAVARPKKSSIKRFS